VLHKIPNLVNDKQIFCKLPHPIHGELEPEVCLIVKDADPKKKKDRDFDKSVRKYQQLVNKHNLSSVIKHILPIRQLKLEFRNFETKRKLCTSFDMFLADKCLHDILYNGSKLGVEFRKRKKMPIEVELENEKKDLESTVKDIVLNSTAINFNGKGALIDIKAFSSTHSVTQILENLSAIKKTLAAHLPGGEANIKAMYVKATNTVAVPIFVADQQQQAASLNEIKVPSNMTPKKVKRERKKAVKRLQKKKASAKRKRDEKKHPRQLIIDKTKSELLLGNNKKTTPPQQQKPSKEKKVVKRLKTIVS